MNRVSSPIEIVGKWILFLFPIGIVTVPHWSSGFFALLALIGIFSLRKNLSMVELGREEKVVAWLFAMLFFSFLLSATANGWEHYHVRYLEDEIRFLLFLPTYLLVRRVDGAMKALVQGSVLGILMTAGVAFYETSVLGIGRAEGAYSPLLLGPVVVTMVFVVANHLRLMGGSPFWRSLALVAIPLGVYAAYLSISRAAYVLVVVLSVITIFMQAKRRSARSVWIVVFVLAGVMAYQYAPKVTHSVDRIAQGLSEIADADSFVGAGVGGSGSSTKTRIVMWHAAYQIFLDHPWLGIGRGGYSHVIEEYVESGRVNPVVKNHGHPHNIYAEIALSKGVVGLSIFIFLIAYLYRWIFRCLKSGVATASISMIILSSLVIGGMFEASLVIKGNYIAFYLVSLAVAMSAMRHRESEEEKG